ncbi:Na+/H+ antiporter NhaC family protein [Anoxynatronum buryatiense]|uniref:Transporter, NhaC family n=1 Tax=Anoxynatronum buryatiense TaxID=489973 RepID=A0AA45WT65_9CLOT|nr:Na+/H+ antiporter NhaC family protein [Anoxynatronum buryatiense]SMP40907.1 transporter, NhaC family [Anoxynatronum buryatiense]
MDNMGIISIIPAIFLIVYIFYTKRILEALTLACLMGFFIGHRGGFFTAFIDGLLDVSMDYDMIWLWVVCGLMGSIIALIEKAGGSFAFGEWVARRAKTRKSTLIWTWILGIGIFIDDYLNSLTVGSCMAPNTDRHKVSREMLAYVVDSTAAPICVLIPISTWAVFAAALLEANGFAPRGEGMLYFIRTIPYNFYAWIAAIIVPLVIIGVIPLVGPMKKAEQRAQETGVLAPPGSEKIDIKAGEIIEAPENPKIINFFLPMIFLVAATIYFEVDMMMGVITTVAFMYVLYIPQKIMTSDDFWDLSIKGIKNMIYPLMLMVLAFLFAEANEQIGFTSYIIESATPLMTPHLLPLVVFIVLTITEFITGTNWGMYIIALPIVIPLALNVGANPFMAIGAVLSAGVFGSHICFYSDATILTSAACGCDNFQHALSQMYYGFIAAGLSAVAFLVAGFIF